MNTSKADRTMGLRVPRKTFVGDAMAGLVMAIVSIPGALANGVLAGVNPVYGLYSVIAGTSVAALFTSSVIMNVDSTSATALATLDAMEGVPADQHLAHLVVLGLLVGVFMILFGVLKLGALFRFISNAVMTGFLSGLGVITFLGQIGDLTTHHSDAGNKVLQTVDALAHIRAWDLATVGVGVLTILVIVGVDHTRFKKLSFAVGVVAATLLVMAWRPETVALVGDSTAIPSSLPMPRLPDLSLVVSMLLPALTITIIALVQSAGISGSVPNPDGDYPDPSGDSRGQGMGNLAVGLVGGIPVGGSLSGTFLIRSVGGKSRWANVLTGGFSAIAVLLIAPFIERIPMPALSGLLMLVGISMIKVPNIRTVWHTGPFPTSIMAITFACTLLAPLQVAVGLGVALHILLHVYRSAEAVRLERIEQGADGGFRETTVPKVLPGHECVVLVPVGSLFFAGAAELEDHLPDVDGATRSVVLLALRNRDEVGSTFIKVFLRYAKRLITGGNKLMFVGVNDRVLEQFKDTGLLDVVGAENAYPENARIGASLTQAMEDAKAWIDEGAGA